MGKKVKFTLTDSSIINLVREEQAFGMMADTFKTNAQALRDFENTVGNFFFERDDIQTIAEGWRKFVAYAKHEAVKHFGVEMAKCAAGDSNIVRFEDDPIEESYTLYLTNGYGPIRVYDNGSVTHRTQYLGHAAYCLYKLQEGTF